MQAWKSVYVLILASFLSIYIVSCSEEDSSTTDPITDELTMSGTFELPDTSSIELDEITVSFGDSEQPVDSSGAFEVSGSKGIPGLAVAYAMDSIPLLLSVISDPQQGVSIPLSVRSTALAAVFLSPGVCVGSEPQMTDEVLSRLNNLPLMDSLEALLQQKLAADAYALNTEDTEIATAIINTVDAFYDSFAAPVPGNKTPFEANSLAQVSDGIYISPTTQTSGHALTHVSENTFEITNAYGRYAVCYVRKTEEKFVVVPNGGMFDFFIDGLPWAPSQATFSMSVAADGDSALVDLYGYGLDNVTGSYWSDLTAEERTLAHHAGLLTIILEFGGGMVDLVGNTNALLNLHGKYVDLGKSYKVVEFLLSDVTFMASCEMYINQGEYGKLSWEVITKFVKKLVSDPQYLQIWGEFTGKYLSNATIQKLKGSVLAPALAISSGLAIGNKMNQVFNTEAGLLSARFKTRFKVWKDVEEFGSVSGQVADQVSGLGIQGAAVHISGDINNPLDPSHDASTDAGGYYSFSNIGIGDKVITASKAEYKTKTVSVTIEKDTTITLDITLEPQTGSAVGRVLNEILIEHGQDPGLFVGGVDLVAREIGGDHEVLSYSITDGTYSLTLTPGQWWIVAENSDYEKDSVQITVASDGSTGSIPDIILVPIISMTGTIYLDNDANGSYETNFSVDFPQVGLTTVALHDACPFGGQPMPEMILTGIRGSAMSDFDAALFAFDTTLITGPGNCPFGGFDYFGCSDYGVRAAAAFLTSRAYCQDPGGSYPMTYTYMGDPEWAGCNCGITLPGDLYITQWGTNLADIVAGNFVIDLAGWTGCMCSGSDTDSDGIIDTWDVDCAQARLDLYFRVPVGTEYKVTWVPGSSSATSIQDMIRERLDID